MTVSWDSRRLYVNNKPFYIHGMNLFLDKRRPEKSPRIIYTPPLVSSEILDRIIINLKDLGINTVRIWPTIKDSQHVPSIPVTSFSKFEKAGIMIILNLPVNWNQRPSLIEIKRFLKQCNSADYNNIIMYCISNECYYGLFTPINYLKKVNTLVKKMTDRPTLSTHSIMNILRFTESDILGGSYFSYNFSMTGKHGVEDVGKVLQMRIEDAYSLYKFFPKVFLNKFYLLERILKWLAMHEPKNSKGFRKRLFSLVKISRKYKKPVFVAEYGYADNMEQFNRIWDKIFVSEMMGYCWYSWVNFDRNMDGRVENKILFDEFKKKINLMNKILKLS